MKHQEMSASFLHVFRYTSFRRFWIGFALSDIGDTLTRVALTWYVWEITQSPQALGWLTFFYTMPVILGGLAAGWLLDRFDRRRVMMADSLLRGTIIAVIPLLHALGQLDIWHVYAAVVFYGFLMMISLAGGPTIVPSLVPEESLGAANALETLAFTLSGVVAPPLAGLLIPLIGAPNIVILDALTYFIFALALSGVRYQPIVPATHAESEKEPRLQDAFRLLRRNPILLSTTLMAMAFNIGFGISSVWLPVYADRSLGGGAELYGFLLGLMALGQLASSVIAGSWIPPLPLGRMIGLSQALAGGAITLLLFGSGWATAYVGMLLFGFFHAPLTIWAQTLRMQIIPAKIRGRTFALLRMLMMSANPIGGILGGGLSALLGIPTLIGMSAALAGLPGVLGLRVRALGGEPKWISQTES